MKKIIAGVVLIVMVLIVGGFALQKESFSYRYVIVTNSNQAADLLVGYQEKEYLVATYNKLIDSIDDNLIEQAIKDNLSYLCARGEAIYGGGEIRVVIGQGKGIKITGSLKKNECDQSAVNKKSFILDWLFGW